ncbi:MAG: leucine-rich repeat domain-containing protein [Candidatus Saganbacteria bacterium]|nr:leucine-rich repeat domain-containing protein [Candidatus Saganbacteria bacterium]
MIDFGAPYLQCRTWPGQQSRERWTCSEENQEVEPIPAKGKSYSQYPALSPSESFWDYFAEGLAGLLFAPWGCGGRTELSDPVTSSNQKSRPDAGVGQPVTPDAAPAADTRRDALFRDLVIGVPEVGPLPDNCHPADGILTGNFTDPNLLAGLRLFLGKGAGDEITTQDALNASYYLEMRQQNISSLAGLECFANLTYLFLPGNKIESLLPLSQLTRLVYVDLNDNRISDLIPLSGLRGLIELHLNSNQIADIKPLSQLPSLLGLSLDNNRIADFSPLSHLANLLVLSLRSNQTGVDPAPLSGLIRLNTLDLTENQLSDLSALSGLTALTSLNIQHNLISDISVLQAMTRLNLLIISGNPVTDLSPLAGLAGLNYLYFGNTSVRDLSPLKNLTSLQAVYANDLSPTIDLTPLIDNSGFGAGDEFMCSGPNSLPDSFSQAQLDALAAKGVTIIFIN